jgi:S1-C subfamily serine protease
MKYKKTLVFFVTLIVVTLVATSGSQTYGSSPQATDIITRGELDNILNNYAQKIEEQTISMVNKTVKSSVLVSSYTKNDGVIDYFGKTAQQGSGFFISDKYILTNKHVVFSRDRVLKVNTSDTSPTYDAKLVYLDENKDLALVEILNYKSSDYLILGSQPKTGQSVFTVGNPSAFTFTASKGIVSKEDSYAMTQLDISINSGSSGSPVVDNKGYLVGIIRSRAKEQPNVGFAIKVYDIQWFAKYCIEYGSADATQINEFLGLTSPI